MTNERLKQLLLNALIKFANDEYEKENVLNDLGITESEFNEITNGETIDFIVYD